MNKKTHFGYKEVEESDKSKYVADVFTSVSKNYDIMNDAMSFGMHRLWKKILVELAAIGEEDIILDIASGTGDISKIISKEYPNTSIFMSDINYDMLDEGRNRAINESFYSNCSFNNRSSKPCPGSNKSRCSIFFSINIETFFTFFTSTPSATADTGLFAKSIISTSIRASMGRRAPRHLRGR